MPLPVVLEPGRYALLLGSGQFGADGSAAIPNMATQPNLPPTTNASYLRWRAPLPEAGPRWTASPEGNMRLVVRGIAFGGQADIDRNGIVNGSDFELWSHSLGTLDLTPLAPGDANSDGTVDGSDFLIWQQEADLRGNGELSGSARTIPEPTGGMLAAALWLLTIIFPRSRGVRSSSGRQARGSRQQQGRRHPNRPVRAASRRARRFPVPASE